MVSLPQVSPLEPCAHLSPPPYAPHAPPISFFSILPPAQYWVTGPNVKHVLPFQEYLQGCLHRLEDMVTATINSREVSCSGGSSENGGNVANGSGSVNSRSSLDHSSSMSGEIDKIAEYGKAGTPTDVRDIHF